MIGSYYCKKIFKEFDINIRNCQLLCLSLYLLIIHYSLIHFTDDEVEQEDARVDGLPDGGVTCEDTLEV